MIDSFTRSILLSFELFRLAVSGAAGEIFPRSNTFELLSLTRRFDAQSYAARRALMATVAAQVEVTRIQLPDADVSRFDLLGSQVSHAALELAAQHKLLSQHGYQIATGDLVRARSVPASFIRCSDSSGRRWDPASYIRTVTRDCIYQATIDQQIADVGRVSDIGRVVYPDAGHEGHGLRFSISGKDRRYPALADIRGRIFHVNATAQVRSDVSPE